MPETLVEESITKKSKPVIEIEEGSPISREYRHELKFILDGLKEDWIHQQIKMHPAGFVRAYPPRYINNIYFDTYDFKAYQENLSGASGRLKVRYRWYGEEPYPTSGTLEVKCKRNQFGWKENYKIKESPYGDGDHWKMG